MATQLIDNTINDAFTPIDKKYMKYDGPNFSFNIIHLAQTIKGHLTKDEAKYIDKKFYEKLSQTSDVQGIPHQVVTNQLPIENTVSKVFVPIIKLGDVYDDEGVLVSVDEVIETTGITKKEAEKLYKNEPVKEECYFQRTNKSIGRSTSTLVYTPDQNGILKYMPNEAIKELEPNAIAIVEQYHRTHKQFKITATAEMIYIKPERNDLSRDERLLVTPLYGIKAQ